MNKRTLGFAYLLLTWLTTAHAQTPVSAELPEQMKNHVAWRIGQEPGDRRVAAPTADKTAEYRQAGYGIAKLLSSHDIEIKDSIVEETVTSIDYYITDSEIENSGNDTFWINIDNQKAEILEAYVLQPDGQRIQVDPKTLQFNSDNSSGTFNDYFYVSVPYPQLKKGSISVLTYKLITDKKRSPMPWARILYPAGFTHIENFKIRAHWKSETQKPVWKTDYAKLNCREEPFSLTCDSQQASPPFPIEADMPSAYDLLPTIVVAEPGSWKSIAATMEALSSSALAANSPTVRDLAYTLMQGAKSQSERLDHLTEFVASKVRYVGLEHGANSLTPKPTNKTLEQRYGDCKDKTMLFVDMARNLGFDAYPVLTSTNRKAPTRLLLPTSAYFNHMIACVNTSKKGEQCVDLTDPNSSVGNLPHYLQGAVMLRVGRNNETPDTLPKELYTWQFNLKAKNRFVDNGSITENLERSYQTHWGAQLRQSLSAKNKQETEQWLREDYYNVYTDQVTPELQVSGVEQYGEPLTISSNTRFDKVFDPQQFSNYYEYELWLRNIITQFKTLGFNYPYQFQGLRYRSEISYLLGERTIDNTGPTINYFTPWGALTRWYDKNGSNLTVTTEVRLPQAAIPISKIAEFNRFLDLIYQENKIWFSLKKPNEK